jgi:hypothetical protein
VLLALRQAQSDDVRIAVPGPVFVVVALVAIVIASYLLHARATAGRRDRAIRRLAEARGWRYAANDPAGLGDLRFRSFAGAKHALVTNVITDDQGRGAVRAFDYSLLFERTTWERDSLWSGGDDLLGFDRAGGPKVQKSCTRRRTGAVVRVDAFLPALTATPATFISRAFEGVGVSDLDFDSVEFNRKWDVRCVDERFAWLFCDASMIDVILELGAGVAVETFGNYVLFTRELVEDADALFRFVELIAGVPQLLNPLVREEYPTVAAMESRAMIDDWLHRPDGRSGVY